MENSLNEVNSEMEKSKTPLDKLNSKLSEQGEKLKSLQTQYKNVVLEQGKNSTEAKSLASQIKSLNSDIKENKNKLNEAENATNKLGGEMEYTGKKASVFGDVLKANLASDAIKAGLNGIVKRSKILCQYMLHLRTQNMRQKQMHKAKYKQLKKVNYIQKNKFKKCLKQFKRRTNNYGNASILKNRKYKGKNIKYSKYGKC